MGKISIFLADDHTILRNGLRYIIEKESDYKIIGESGNGRDALEKIEKLQPDIAILDISMPSMTGIEISRQLKKYHPEIKVIILSQYDNEEYVQKLLKYGINGYVLKDNASENLLNAITAVIHGNVYLCPKITNMVISDYITADKIPDGKKTKSSNSILSPREMEILKLIAEGNSNNKIASILFISEKTVKNHRSNIMNKLNIHSTVDLVKYAIKSRLVEA